MNKITLKRVSEADCRFFWEVNNQPGVRRQSIQPEPIPYADHEKWFAASLALADRHLWIGYLEGNPFGVVRFDVTPPEATISIALLESFQGFGLGHELIDAASEQMLRQSNVQTLIAFVRPENSASLRAFEKAGYRLIGNEASNGVSLMKFVKS